MSTSSRRISARTARDVLVEKLADGGASVEESQIDNDSTHKRLVREAGRAAVEESLCSKKRKKDMSAAGIVAQWRAYAEVYGTNGMAAGGARSALVDAPQDVVCASEPTQEILGTDAAAETTNETAQPLEPRSELSSDHGASRLAIWDF